MLLTNHSFAEVFDGDNPLHPVGAHIEDGPKKVQDHKIRKDGGYGRSWSRDG